MCVCLLCGSILEVKKRIDNDNISLRYSSLFTLWNGDIIPFYYFMLKVDRRCLLLLYTAPNTDFGLSRHFGFWYDELSFVKVEINGGVSIYVNSEHARRIWCCGISFLVGVYNKKLMITLDSFWVKPQSF